MSLSLDDDPYHLHRLVWDNKYSELEKVLVEKASHTPATSPVETKDPRGRTPLHLSVSLGHLETTRVLLRNGANANAENSRYWTVVQEAVATGDPELVQICLQHRDYQRYTQRTEGVPGLLQKLRETPDFYVEMKWEFTSWVPLVSRMCPSDTYKVYKSGSNVRIDTTLLGFDSVNWQRGSRSFVFKGDTDSATVMEIDHDAHQIYEETMKVLPVPPDISFLAPSEGQVAARLTSPIMTTYIDTDKISFERSRSGIWGWRSDKNETVNTHECKVFSASNVHLVTKTRTEHMTDHDKKQSKKQNRNPLESFLGIAEQQEKQQNAAAAAGNGSEDMLTYNPCNISADEYFNPELNLEGRDIGRPLEQTTKTQKFKANLCLCEDYPLSLQEQVIPIIDLMATSNAHFAKLKDFITLQLPSGFPVKIEIPLFHVLNARITFGNIFGADVPVDGVDIIDEGENGLSCSVQSRLFDAPRTYSVIGGGEISSGGGHERRLRDEDDELLQFAIQQSLLSAGSENEQVTFWEALNKDNAGNGSTNPPPGTGGSGINYTSFRTEEERQLQRVLEESMRDANLLTTQNGEQLSPSSEGGPNRPLPPIPAPNPADAQLQLALELSRKEKEDAEKRQRDEEEELERILALSLTEK